PERVVTYIVDRNINYTNVCGSRCRFCAFWREADSPEAYVLGTDEVLRKVGELADAGGTQVLMQGGLHPGLGLDWICELLAAIRREYPHIDLHSLSPPEVHHYAQAADLPLGETLRRLRDAGLSSLPGGGAEILVDDVRSRVSPAKCTAAEWLQVMREAHGLGMKSTATMMFGHLDSPEDRVDHMLRVRELQDETGGFTAFIAWTLQASNTELAGTLPLGGYAYLRTLAVARLALDNVPNLQASWVTQGAKIAQLSLRFGANDLGGTMMEENVVAAAGCRFRIDVDELRKLAAETGLALQQRRTDYSLATEA
ncbi:MAG: dehypoxanthine futalosine cyclase, partial [Armatimonadia bacterium]|nr:dehypoxanthine futalosine cyclase [Armatimonadia bacterium]